VHQDRDGQRRQADGEERARNDIGLPHRHHALSAQQVLEEHLVDRLGRVDHQVIDAALAEQLGDRGDVVADEFRVAGPQAPGTTGIRSPLSRSSKVPAASKVKFNSAGSSRCITTRSCPASRNGQARRESCPPARTGSDRMSMMLFDAALRHLSNGMARDPRPRGSARSSACSTWFRCLAEHGTMSTMSESTETNPTRSRWRWEKYASKRRGTSRTVASTGRRRCCIPSTRNVEDRDEIRVGIGLVLLQVQPIRSRIQPPVHVAGVVARHVLPVLGKVVEKPRCGERWSPEMNPSTTNRAMSSRSSMRASTLGSRNRRPGTPS